MMRLRRASAIATLSLLAWAATASAECAWVLWVGSIKPIEDWSISGAHPTLRDCSADLNDLGHTYQGQGYQVAGLMPTARSVAYKKGDNDKGYMHCLPDTVDPRGPKGK